MPNITSISGVAANLIVKRSGHPRANITGLASRSPNRLSFTDSIVTTNLVQHLDAGDSNSYPGSGTTWTDLIGNTNGTFINTPTYSSTEGGGSFFFDGVDDAIRFNYDDAAPIRIGEDTGEVNGVGGSGISRTYGDLDTDGGITMQFWVRPISNGASNNQVFCVWSNNSSVPTSYGTGYNYYQGIEVLVFGNGTFGFFMFDGNGGNSSADRRDMRTSNADLLSYQDTWVNLAITIPGDDVGTAGSGTDILDSTIYIQGSSVSTTTLGGTGSGLGYRSKWTSTNTMKLHGGIGLQRGNYRTGYISEVLIYNDVLTSSEIQQNYNATKARYGY